MGSPLSQNMRPGRRPLATTKDSLSVRGSAQPGLIARLASGTFLRTGAGPRFRRSVAGQDAEMSRRETDVGEAEEAARMNWTPWIAASAHGADG